MSKQRKHNLPASYLRDFMDNLDPCEVDKLDRKDTPAVIFIENYQEFQQIILTALMVLGLKRKEIIITRVQYINFEKFSKYSWWDFGQKSPLELAIKDKRFESQSEARIIINTDDIRIKRILEKPIEIGQLKYIVSMSNTYLHGGVSIELIVELKILD